MSELPIKGCLQPIIKRIETTAKSRRRDGKTVTLTLACGHILEKRASSVAPTAKRIQCWECVSLGRLTQ